MDTRSSRSRGRSEDAASKNEAGSRRRFESALNRVRKSRYRDTTNKGTPHKPSRLSKGDLTSRSRPSDRQAAENLFGAMEDEAMREVWEDSSDEDSLDGVTSHAGLTLVIDGGCTRPSKTSDTAPSFAVGWAPLLSEDFEELPSNELLALAHQAETRNLNGEGRPALSSEERDFLMTALDVNLPKSDWLGSLTPDERNHHATLEARLEFSLEDPDVPYAIWRSHRDDLACFQWALRQESLVRRFGHGQDSRISVMSPQTPAIIASARGVFGTRTFSKPAVIPDYKSVISSHMALCSSHQSTAADRPRPALSPLTVNADLPYTAPTQEYSPVESDRDSGYGSLAMT